MYHTKCGLMNNTRKTIAVFLTLIVAMSCLTMLTVKPANAQLYYQPPEFTVQFVGHPQTVTVDPYTGANVTHTNNGEIVISIKNPTYDLRPYNIYDYRSYYAVQTKGHFAPDSNWTQIDWTTYYPSRELFQDKYGTFYPASTAQYTNISLPADIYPANSQIDFQVKVLTANITQYFVQTGGTIFPSQVSGVFETGPVIITSSTYSNTQTVTIPDATSPTPTVSIVPNSSTPTTISSQFNSFLVTNAISLTVIAALLAIIVVLLLFLRHRKIANLKQ